MGTCTSRILPEKEEVQTLKQLGDMENLDAFIKHISDNVDRWKNETVKLGIIGRSGTGKSSFINAMRDVRPGHENFAPSGSGNTTQNIGTYHHSTIDQLVFYDLPGLGTLQFRKDKFIQDTNLNDYDYYIVFLDKVIGEDESWIVRILKERNKPFCLVRSKIDEDLVNASHDGKVKEDVMSEIRTQIKKASQKHNALYPDNKIAQVDSFLISSRDKGLGDMERLVEHIEKKIPTIKFEILMYNISNITELIIDKKYQMLRRRILLTTLFAALHSAILIADVNLKINAEILVDAIRHYTDVFCLTKEEIKTLPELIQRKLKCRNVIIAEKDVEEKIISELKSISTTSDLNRSFNIPHMSVAAINTAAVAYKFLRKFLDSIRDDAKLVFNYRVMHATRPKL